MSTPLHPALVDAIFAKLLVTYGSKLTAMYQGQDMLVIRNNWARELAGLDERAVKHGLSLLPSEFPPTVLSFKRDCWSVPPIHKALPAPQPKASAEVAARALEAMKRTKRAVMSDPRTRGVEWAYAVLERARTGAGLRPTPTALRMTRDALASRGLSGDPGSPDVEATQ